MRKLLKIPADRRAVAWLIVIAVLTHFHWLFNFNVFTSGDWWFISEARYLDFRSFSPIWITEGLGATSAVPPFYFIRFLEGLLTYVGGGFVLAEKLFFFLPMIFVAPLGSYLFLRQYFSPKLAFIGSVIFTFNTPVLFNYAGALTIGTAYALTPLILYCFRQLLRYPKNATLLIVTALLLAIAAAYEQRIVLLILGMAGGLFLYNTLCNAGELGYFRRRIWPLTKLAALVVLLHAFWLIPYVINAKSGVTFSDLLSRQLFVSFSDIQNALTLFHPFWTGARPATFVIQDIPLYAWVLPVLAFGGFLLPVKRSLLRQNKEIAYWAFIALVGIFLVKQVNEPFIGAYPWLYEHLPGAAAFREASKFYLLIIMGYAVLVPFTLATIKQWASEQWPRTSWPLPKILTGVASAAVLLLFAINTLPLLSGTFRTLYIPRQMPADYATLERFINEQPDYFRLLWVPTNSRWGVQSNRHPSVAASQLNQGAWLSQLGVDQQDEFPNQRDKSLNLFAEDTGDTMLDRASVKYVIVPLRDTANEDDFFRSYGDDRRYFLERLDQVSYLKKIDIGTRDLVVYENQDYQPHVNAFSSLQSLDLDKGVSIDPFFAFIKDELKQSLNFVVPPKKNAPTENYPKTPITDVFQTLQPAEVTDAGVQKKLTPASSPELYLNTADRQIRYVVQAGKITFYGQRKELLLVNRQAVGNPPTEEVLATAILDQTKPHYLVFGDQLAIISGKDEQRDLGSSSESLSLYTGAGANTIKNHSFEGGVWQAEVKDCNPYDQRPIISMKPADGFSTDGQRALQLSADRHTACTDTGDIKLGASHYLLAFDYHIVGGQTVGYEITFNDPAKTKIKQDIDTTHEYWQTYQRLITAPKDATAFTFRLLGYPDYRMRKHAVTSYDNVRMLPLEQKVTVAKTKPAYQKLSLEKQTDLTFLYPTTEPQAGQNLVPGSTFDQELWQKEVGDCNKYDDEPDIGMSHIARDQGKALELRARRHGACTSRGDIPIKELGHYLLSFDYQSPNARAVHYRIEFNDSVQTTVEEDVRVTKSGWQPFVKQLQAPLGASKATITLFAYEEAYGLKTIIARYDNVSLKAIPDLSDRYYLVDQPGMHLETPRTVAFDTHGAAKKTVQVRGATTPFYLATSESYNPLWRVALDNMSGPAALWPTARADAVPRASHFKLNDFQNGWYVDPAQLCQGDKKGCTRHPDGSYDLDLVVEFVPQRWFYLGTVISGLTLLGSALYLGRTVWRNRKRRWWKLHEV